MDTILGVLETVPPGGKVQTGVIAALTDGQALGNYFSLKNSMQEALRDQIFSKANSIKALVSKKTIMG